MMVNGNPRITVIQKAQEPIVQTGVSGQKAPETGISGQKSPEREKKKD